MGNNKKKLNNKGFSLVELIVVIAIMAILTGVIAPQVMKYIEKSRVSTDTSNADAIKSSVQIALAEEKAYESAKTLIGIDGFSFRFNDAVPTATVGGTSLTGTDFLKELSTVITKWPKVKASGQSGFEVKIDPNLNVTVKTY